MEDDLTDELDAAAITACIEGSETEDEAKACLRDLFRDIRAARRELRSAARDDLQAAYDEYSANTSDGFIRRRANKRRCRILFRTVRWAQYRNIRKAKVGAR